MLHLVNQVGEEELMGAYDGQYLPYQNEPIVTSAENTSDEDDEMDLDDDAAQHDDGIRRILFVHHN